MNSETFVNEFKELRDSIKTQYFSPDGDISRLEQLEANGFTVEQIKLVQSLFGDALSDALYTVLLGLDGEASISRHQEAYRLFSESGQELTGQIESIAWEKFHGDHT